MTVIAGLAHKGTVHIGADSAGISGYELRERRDAKVFRNGPYAMGFTTSFRMGQLLHHALQPPAPPEDDADLHRFMVTTWVDAVRDCLKTGGWAKKDSEQEEGGTFLVGVRGRLFVVDSDYQVAEPADNYAAVGCGNDVALGALHVSGFYGFLTPQVRVKCALETAEKFSAGVRGPFTYVEA